MSRNSHFLLVQRLIWLLFCSAENKESKKYGFELEFFAEVEKEGSAWNTSGRSILLSVAKKDKEAESWPRLLKEKGKNSKITTDWDKWVESDEEEEEGGKGMDGFDPSMM